MDEKRCSLNPIEAKILSIEFIQLSWPSGWVCGLQEFKRAASFEEVRLNTTGIRALPHLINE